MHFIAQSERGGEVWVLGAGSAYILCGGVASWSRPLQPFASTAGTAVWRAVSGGAKDERGPTLAGISAGTQRLSGSAAQRPSGQAAKLPQHMQQHGERARHELLGGRCLAMTAIFGPLLYIFAKSKRFFFCLSTCAFRHSTVYTFLRFIDSLRPPVFLVSASMVER